MRPINFVRTVVMLVGLVMTLALSIGCETESAEPQSECGDWAADPQRPGADCTNDPDCGDPSVCVAPKCYDGECVYEQAPNGMACAQCNVFGFCGDGACISFDEWSSSQFDCASTDPCVDSTYDPIHGCVLSERHEGWTCTVAGAEGVCRAHACYTGTF
jgi:hypothetical protein